MTNRHWGLETGILRITHEAEVYGFWHYAMATFGWRFLLDLVNEVNARIVGGVGRTATIAARKIGGVGRTAGIENLHFAMKSYVVNWAKFMEGYLGAQTSIVYVRVLSELLAY